MITMAYYVPHITAWVLQSLIQKQPTKEFCQKQATKKLENPDLAAKIASLEKNRFAPPQK